MSELIYDKTFEEALEAINQGHKARHKDSGGEQKTLDDMLWLVEKIKPYFLRGGWAIIEKKTDRDILVDHFDIGERHGVLIFRENGSPDILIGNGRDKGTFKTIGGQISGFMGCRLATKEEATALVLGRDEWS